MYECQILVRLKNTTIQNKYGKQYGNCQVCNEKYSQYNLPKNSFYATVIDRV